jgi:hypothetical protein
MTAKNKNILIIVIILVAGVAIAVPLAVKHYSKPDFAKMTPQQIRQYFDSNEFRDANEDKRREAFSQMRDAMETRAETQANEYAALTQDAKTVYLDKIIDEMQARRAEFMARDANDGNAPDPNRFRRFGPQDPNGQRRQMANQRQFRTPEPSRMRARSERTSTDTRVKMMQFRQDLFNRMQERGVQMGGPGGRLGPFGGGGGPGGPGGGGPGGPPPGGR